MSSLRWSTVAEVSKPSDICAAKVIGHVGGWGLEKNKALCPQYELGPRGSLIQVC